MSLSNAARGGEAEADGGVERRRRAREGCALGPCLPVSPIYLPRKDGVGPGTGEGDKRQATSSPA